MPNLVAQQIHVGDAGLQYIVTLTEGAEAVDLSRATLVEFHFQKPDGSMLVVPATLAGGGQGGVCYYVTTPTDFDQDGTWRQQVYYEVGPEHYYSNINKFRVYPNLPLES